MRNLKDSTVIDRISNLPDGVTAHILSMLPVKDAGRTSVLSKDWETKWKSIYNWVIDVREFFPEPSENNAEVFEKFVATILAQRHNLTSFHIKFSDLGEYIHGYFTFWIFDVLNRKVKNLQITMSRADFGKYPSEEPMLYCSHHSSGLLENLEVVMRFTFKVVDRNCFAKLVSLKLDGVILVNENDSDTMVFNFPVIREIELEQCMWSRVHVVEMHAPLLNIFRSAVGAPLSNRFRYASDEVDDYEIKIVGSNLEKLTCFGPPENIILTSSPVYASLQFYRPNFPYKFEECGFQIRKLFGELSRVKKMEIMGFLEAVAKTKQELPLRSLIELEELKVASNIDAEGLLEVLHATPNLKFLHIEFGSENDWNYYPDHFDYDAVESVPSCLVSKLEKVKLDYVDVEKSNLSFARFLLKNGARLKNIFVYGSTNEIILDELRKSPKGSNCLIIEGSTCSTSS